MAARLLQKAADVNETQWRNAPGKLGEGRERVAKGFAVLAAIDKGLLPAPVADDLAGWMTDASRLT